MNKQSRKGISFLFFIFYINFFQNLKLMSAKLQELLKKLEKKKNLFEDKAFPAEQYVDLLH